MKKNKNFKLNSKLHTSELELDDRFLRFFFFLESSSSDEVESLSFRFLAFTLSSSELESLLTFFLVFFNDSSDELDSSFFLTLEFSASEVSDFFIGFLTFSYKLNKNIYNSRHI